MWVLGFNVFPIRVSDLILCAPLVTEVIHDLSRGMRKVSKLVGLALSQIMNIVMLDE